MSYAVEEKPIFLDERTEHFLDFNGAIFSVFYDPDRDEFILRGHKQDENGNFEMLFEEVIDTAGV